MSQNQRISMFWRGSETLFAPLNPMRSLAKARIKSIHVMQDNEISAEKKSDKYDFVVLVKL